MLCTAEEQGQVLGALAGVQSIAFGIGPWLFNSLFSWLLRLQIARDGSAATGSTSDLPESEAVGGAWFISPLPLGPRDCFVAACVPALLCVGLAASIPDPKVTLRKMQAGAGLLQSPAGGDL